jgi:hypothetical protein
LHQKHEIDLFAATFSDVQQKDGEIVSYCVWGNGIESLLPVTQKFTCMEEGRDGPSALGDWTRVVEIVGERMEPTDDYPRRYHVTEFPDAAALAAIGLGKM